MEYLKEIAIGTLLLKTTMWLRYINDTFMFLAALERCTSIAGPCELSKTFCSEKGSSRSRCNNKFHSIWDQVIDISQANIYRTLTEFHYPGTIKKQIVHRLQHWAKLIRDDPYTCQQQMLSFMQYIAKNASKIVALFHCPRKYLSPAARLYGMDYREKWIYVYFKGNTEIFLNI